MENEDCQYCEYSYMAGDELECTKHEIITPCNDYELAEYFAKIYEHEEELKQGNK